MDPRTHLTKSFLGTPAHSHATLSRKFEHQSLMTPLPRSYCTLFQAAPLLEYHLCDVLLLHMFFLSAPSLIRFFPLCLLVLLFSFCSFSSPLYAFVSSVRRGPVLFTTLSPQARGSLFCLQPPSEARVQSLRPAQPSPALFLQHWTLPKLFVPHHPSK